MFPFKRQKNKLGIEFSDGCISLAVYSASTNAITRIEAFREPSATDLESYHAVLNDYIHEHNLQNLTTHVVLPAKDYRFLLVEKPDVPEEELRAAVKWRVKDLVQNPIDTLVVDVFHLPDDARSGGKPMLYAVVTDLAKVKSIMALTEAIDVKLSVIDIDVFALRNLTQFKPHDRGIALVRVAENSADLSIFREGNLYLARRFQLNYGAGFLDELPADSLALEVQRSFDYFERQMGQIPPGQLYICGEGINEHKLTPEVRQSLSVPIELLDVSQDIGLADGEDNGDLQQLCMAAVGATYREAL